MADERTPGRERRPDPDRSTQPATRDEGRADLEETGRKPTNPNPWTREGADAPDAADIENPKEQR